MHAVGSRVIEDIGVADHIVPIVVLGHIVIAVDAYVVRVLQLVVASDDIIIAGVKSAARREVAALADRQRTGDQHTRAQTVRAHGRRRATSAPGMEQRIISANDADVSAIHDVAAATADAHV